jgi:hypothetical protein
MENTIQFEDRDQLYGTMAKELNLKKIDEVFYPHNAGSYIVTFSAGEFLIQYGMDRLQLFIAIASNSLPTRWIDLLFIKNFINNADELNPDVEQADLKYIMELNDFLKNNFNKIAELLNKDNYQHTISQVEALLKQEFIRKHPGAVKNN